MFTVFNGRKVLSVGIESHSSPKNKRTSIKYYLFVTAFIVLINQTQAQVNPVTPAQGFSTFIEGDATLISNETEGNMAIGGDLNLSPGTSYQVSIISAGNVYFNSDSRPTSLLINGTVNFNGGNQIQVNSQGWVKIGDCNGVNVYDTDNSGVSTNTQISASAFNSTPRIQVNTQQPSSTVCSANLIDFTSSFTTLNDYSSRIAGCPENIYFSDQNGNPLSNPDNPQSTAKVILASNTVNILNTMPDALDNIQNLTFQNLSATSPVIINVDGLGSDFTWTIPAFGGSNPNYIFWNFINIPNLTFTGGNTIDGTVYAPSSNLTKNNSGNIQGTVIAKTLMHSLGEIHDYPWTIDLTLCAPSTTCVGGTVDTDNDGIADACDEDDDNDGILDADEGCIECNGNAFINGNFELNSLNGSQSNAQINENLVDGWFTTSTDEKIEIWRAGFSNNSGGPVPAQDGDFFAEINATQTASLYQRVCTRPGAQISWSVWHRGRAGTDVGLVKIGNEFSTAPVQATMTTGNTAWVQYSGIYNVPSDQVFTYFIFEAANTASSNTIGNFVDNIVIQELSAGTCLDTDNDGIPDSKDLDSDGDGCFDVVESGGIDANNDGILDGTGYGLTGLVTGGNGGYDGITGNETLAHQLSITSPPTNQSVVAGNSVNFSVTAIADLATSFNNGTPIYGAAGNANIGLQYQWYLGNPDAGGTILNNGSEFSGVNSATLTINNSEGYNAQAFYVVVKHADNICLRQSAFATLSLTENCSNGTDDDGDGLVDCADPECITSAPTTIVID